MSLAITTVWWTLGFNFVLYLAGLQDIPRELYEAAAIDGARPWQQIRRITIPLLARTTTLVVVLQIIASLKVFDQMYLMTSGGPNFSTRSAARVRLRRRASPTSASATPRPRRRCSSSSCWPSRRCGSSHHPPPGTGALTMTTDRSTPGPQHSAPRPTRQPAQRSTGASKLFNRICAGVLIAFALLWLVPLAWAIDTALKPNAETTKTDLVRSTTRRSPRSRDAARAGRHLELVRVQLHHLAADRAGRGADRRAWPRSRCPGCGSATGTLVFWFILIGIMIPQQVLIVPQFREFNALHLLNTYWAVILPQVPTAIAVFIFKQFFDGLPRDLDEAARIDGAGFFRHLPADRHAADPAGGRRGGHLHVRVDAGTTCCGRCWC